MNFLSLVLCILIPAFISMALTALSSRRLRENRLVALSKGTLYLFLGMRLIYWIGFGILIAGFTLAIVQSGGSGEKARMLIAQSQQTGDGTANFLLTQFSNFVLPTVFLSLFIAVLLLAVIGRKVVKLLPEDAKPGEEFTRFRFTFVLMACSLIFPPLVFGSLLLI